MPSHFLGDNKGSDLLTLNMSEDAYLGDAEFTISVDGVQQGDVQTLTALHGQSTEQFIVGGNFSTGTHTVSVNFLNDAWGWTDDQDRNLYLDMGSLNGVSLPGSSLNEFSSGSQDFSFGKPVSGGDSSSGQDFGKQVSVGNDTLTLKMAEDSYQGDAQFTVKVDGVDVDGVFTSTAENNLNESQDFVLKGSWGSGNHTVNVTFINDLYAGSPSTDRNLYVKNVTFNEVSIRTEMPLLSSGDTATVNVPSVQTDETHSSLKMLGVNLSGAEYGDSSSVENQDYQYPTIGEVNYWSAQGMNVIRLPLMWERIQPTQNGPLDETQLSRIDAVVAQAELNGMKVDLDLHNYGFGYGSAVGSSDLPDSSLADFWGKMATHFADSSNVIYGIMNEPYQQTPTQWASSSQASVTTIRDAGATGQIMMSGSMWDGAHDWVESGNASIMSANVHDPLHKMSFEVHQYFDGNSGKSTDVVSPTVGPDRMAEATTWAREQGATMFLGEFSSGQDAGSITALKNTLDFMQANSDVWQGGTYWGPGPMEGDYMFNADPSHGIASAQSSVLSHYAPDPSHGISSEKSSVLSHYAPGDF